MAGVEFAGPGVAGGGPTVGEVRVVVATRSRRAWPTLRDVLTARGCEVQRVLDVPELERLLRRRHPDAVVLHVGADLDAGAVGRLATRCTVVVLSDYEDSLLAALAAGADVAVPFLG